MTRSGTLRLLVAIVIASTLITPFRRELFVGDETKYSKVIREMRAGGGFFLPTLEGAPFTHKPPLHFWIVDLLTYPFGVWSMWPFVLPSLAAFCFLLWLMWRMGGALAAFVCGTSLMMWGSAQTARMDVGFTALITLGAWLLQRFLESGSPDVLIDRTEREESPAGIPATADPEIRSPDTRPDFRLLTAAGFSIAVATLLKGPMAPVIIAVLFALEWWRRRNVPRGHYAPAVLIMIVVPLLWFVPAMLLGGSGYTHEVLQKQLAGRAVSSWVHQSPPWYYLAHAPAILFPWFFLTVAAVWKRWRLDRFEINWILAVLIPYSLMSSKLDVYMMALIPPVSLVIARYVAAPDSWARRANVLTLVMVLAIAAGALLFAIPQRIHGPESSLAGLAPVRLLFVFLALAAAAGLAVSLRGALPSTLAAGLVPLAAFVYAAIALMPVINDVASTRPLVRALVQQRVRGSDIALFTCPHLWTHDMPRDLDEVQYVSAGTAFVHNPAVIVASRRYAGALQPQLSSYRKTAEVRMIGKWFDVYRR